MSELKTLKNIKVELLPEKELELAELAVKKYEKELRAEAVKWYKKIKSFSPEHFDMNHGTLRFIREFFNLTEEDLK